MLLENKNLYLLPSRFANLIKEFVEKSIEYEYANMPDEYGDRWGITEATKAKEEAFKQLDEYINLHVKVIEFNELGEYLAKNRKDQMEKNERTEFTLENIKRSEKRKIT